VPLAVLVVLVFVLTLERFRRSPAQAGREPAPPTVDRQGEMLGEARSLAGPPPPAEARVAEGAARLLHGDPRRTHRARGRGPKQANVLWTFKTGGPLQAQVTASPDEQTLYVASLDGTLYAVGRDGQKRWSVELGDRVYATPCVADDGTIYVGSDAKRLYAIQPDGKIRFRLETKADADTGPVITPEGLVVFAAGPALYGVRPRGDVAFRFLAKKKIFTAPAIGDDGLIVFGAQDRRVYALRPNGVLAWSVPLGADVDGGPAIGDDGAIYVGTDLGEIVRLDALGGIVWRTNLGGYVRGALSVARNGDVLAGVYGPTPRQVRVSAADGAILGAYPVAGTGTLDFGVHGGALEDDSGTLFFGAQDDAVYAVERTGALRFRFVTEGDVDAPLTLLGDGTLLVPSDDGTLYALAPTPG
jgi:outer membrane protein assembly factor BamB